MLNSRGLLRDCEKSPINSLQFTALVVVVDKGFIMKYKGHKSEMLGGAEVVAVPLSAAAGVKFYRSGYCLIVPSSAGTKCWKCNLCKSN